MKTRDAAAISECVGQDLLIKKAEKGRQFLELLKTGEDVDCRKMDDKTVTEIILNLLHFKQYAFMQQQLLAETNNKLSENVYLLSAKTSKELYDLANGELFDSTIQDLLMFKCRFDESKRQKMYDICFKIVGKELLESGLLKSLQSKS